MEFQSVLKVNKKDYKRKHTCQYLDLLGNVICARIRALSPHLYLHKITLIFRKSGQNTKFIGPILHEWIRGATAPKPRPTELVAAM